MKFVFDLWSYDHVKSHASDMLERVQNGSMPGDCTWPPEQVDAFEYWLNGMHG